MRGLALSGGGFRATLFHLGVIAYLRETGTLKDVTHITSVSGGSILAAHLVLHWERYNGAESEFNEAASEIIRFIQLDVRGRIVRRLPMYFPLYWMSVLIRRLPGIDENSLGWWTRVSTTDLLRRYYSTVLFKKKRLKHLRGTLEKPRPRLYLLTTSIDEPMQASFTSRGFHIDGKDYPCESKDLGLAVSASSAFPGMFPSVLFKPKNGKDERSFRLVDGGVYDNLGVRKFWELLQNDSVRLPEIIVSDASIRFKPADKRSFFEPITTPIKAADILYKRVYDFEKKAAEQVDRQHPECSFRFVRLMEELDPETIEYALGLEYQDPLYSVRTDLDYFSDLEVSALVRHGYAVARAELKYKLPVSETSKPSTSPSGLTPAENQDEASDKKSDIDVMSVATTPWDPVAATKDKLARALLDRDDDTYFEKIIANLNRSAIRRWRVIAMRDWVSYFNVTLLFAILLTVPLFFGFGYLVAFRAYFRPPDPVLERDSGDMTLTHNLDAAAKQYRNILWDRRSLSRLPNAIAADSQGAQPYETWTTGQAVYALALSGELKPNDLRSLATALDDRFPEDGTKPNDWDDSVGGWYTRPGVNNLQAEPALWMMVALARILQDERLDKKLRDKLEMRLKSVEDYLTKNSFISRYDGRIAFNVLANQVNSEIHSPYSTSLGLLALVEMRRANQKWNGAETEELIRGMLTWLDENYNVKTGGWNSVDNDAETSKPDEGANLQILHTMLRAYIDLNVPPPDSLKSRMMEHIKGFGKTPPEDSVARVWLQSKHADRGQEQHEIEIRFLGKPWAIRLCRDVLISMSASVTTEEKVVVLNLLQAWTNNLEESIRADKNDFTFKSSEMLIALS